MMKLKYTILFFLLGVSACAETNADQARTVEPTVPVTVTEGTTTEYKRPINRVPPAVAEIEGETVPLSGGISVRNYSDGRQVVSIQFVMVHNDLELGYIGERESLELFEKGETRIPIGKTWSQLNRYDRSRISETIESFIGGTMVLRIENDRWDNVGVEVQGHTEGAEVNFTFQGSFSVSCSVPPALLGREGETTSGHEGLYGDTDFETKPCQELLEMIENLEPL